MIRHMMAKVSEVRGMAFVAATGAVGVASSPAGMAVIEFVMHILRIPHGH